MNKAPRTLIILGENNKGSASIFRIGAGLSVGVQQAWAPAWTPLAVTPGSSHTPRLSCAPLQVLPVTP